MSTFKEIRGTLIKSLSSDPSPIANGDIWYNSTSQVLKGVQEVGAWSSGGTMNVKRSATIAGTVTAGLASFGYIYPPSSPEGQSVLTEEYNGTNWTAVNDANTARYQVNSTGSQTAAVVLGGATPLKSDLELIGLVLQVYQLEEQVQYLCVELVLLFLQQEVMMMFQVNQLTQLLNGTVLLGLQEIVIQLQPII
jgi:hypothetical protein